jgi:2-dehydro-3-deoxy-D-pentonate aldolase
LQELKELHGVIPALVTPFTAKDELDIDGFRWICDNAISHGVHGLMVNGSLGEFPSLRPTERHKIIELAVSAAAGKIPVIAGVGSPSTQQAVELAKEASDLGADYLMVLPPFYYPVGDGALFAHYTTIADSVDVPVIIYNFPAATKVTLSPSLVAKLADSGNIVGIKNSFDSVIHLRELVRLTAGKRFTVLSGMEDYLLPGLLLGTKGTASGFSNFIPQVLVEIYESFRRNDVKKGSDLFNRVVVPLKALAPPPEPISALKIGVKLVSGKTTAHVRLPLTDAPPDTEKKMAAVLKENGLIPVSSLSAK